MFESIFYKKNNSVVNLLKELKSKIDKDSRIRFKSIHRSIEEVISKSYY